MSEWITYETEIDNRLDELGYSKQPDNYDIDDPDSSNAFIHKGYSLKAMGVMKEYITNSNSTHTYSVELKISFVHNEERTRSQNFEEFDDLITELITNGTNFPNFVSLIEDATFEDGKDVSLQNSIGTIKMYYGLRGC